ncbi:hypothetical protein LUZ60_007968 [Juncus effusus]|nr:hypothetical protein LUZ60_007968 [Juncus effusus]
MARVIENLDDVVCYKWLGSRKTGFTFCFLFSLVKSGFIFVFLLLLLRRSILFSFRIPIGSQLTMDWEGQKRAELLMQILLVASAIAAFATGYLMKDFGLMMVIYAAGVVLTALVTVPNWWFFNKNPLEWLESSEAERHPKPEVVNKSVGGKKKGVKGK